MEKIKKVAGSFVGINEGKIQNCYTAIEINTKSNVSKFCYKNDGKLENILECKSEAKIKRILVDENYHEELTVTGNVVVIKTAKDLYEFARKVNKGYEKYRHANVVLEKNVDCKGKKWIPIGVDQYCAFQGTFNGNGHKIENLKIYQDRLNYVGFFGYIKGATICNLKIDCICKGKRCIGALVGTNDKGKIISCSAVANIHLGETTGGFVGKNSGEISKCYVVGKIMPSIIPIQIIRKIVILAAIIILIAILINKYYKDKVFVPVAIDPNVILDTTQDEEFNGSPTDNKASFEFAQTVVVDSSNMVGTLEFRNPKRGNHNIVIRMLISDKELKEKVGTTGRTKSEQEKLESEEGYNEETNMNEIYHSGLIERGYKLPKIQISNLADGTKLPEGTYSAVVSLEFYKIDTNEKAIVNTNLPVTLIIK